MRLIFAYFRERFLSAYAYTGRPVLIKNVSNSWPAMETFSFNFFKNLYEENKSPVLTKQNEECQFFLWDFQNFRNLGEVFKMDPDRSKLKGNKYVIL